MEHGEAPSTLAKREGKLLRLVFPEEARLGVGRTVQLLQARFVALPGFFGFQVSSGHTPHVSSGVLSQDALIGKERLGRSMLTGVWERQAARREPERRVLYTARALAYLQAGNTAQALEVRARSSDGSSDHRPSRRVTAPRLKPGKPAKHFILFASPLS